MINHTYFIIIMPEYIYLLQEREAIRLNEPVYKVGKTKQENLKRISSYPNGTELLIQIKCDKCDTIEKDLIKLFKEKYDQKTDMGTEYFEGDCNEMIKDIYKAVFKDDSVESCNEMIKDIYKVVLNEDSEGNCNEMIQAIYNVFFKDDYEESEESYDADNLDDVFEMSKNVIDNYSELMKYTDITNIIITNKNKIEGYVKTQNKCWIKILDKETLFGFVKNKIDNRNYIIDYAKLSQDICNKCYNINPNIYKLDYNEFVIFSVFENSEHNLILNTKTFKFNNCDNDINNVIILNDNPYVFTYNITMDIDITIVDNILSALIFDNNIIKQFNKLCYNILVEETETIVFEDYSIKDCLLSEWLWSVMYMLCPNNYLSDFNMEIYEKAVKTRVVFITKSENDTEDQILNQIEICKSLGIKNIVVKHIVKDRIYNNQYNYKKYIDYLVEHKNKIKRLFPIKTFNNNTYYPCNKQYNNIIFDNTDMLFNNFVKWCCTKKE